MGSLDIFRNSPSLEETIQNILSLGAKALIALNPASSLLYKYYEVTSEVEKLEKNEDIDRKRLLIDYIKEFYYEVSILKFIDDFTSSYEKSLKYFISEWNETFSTIDSNLIVANPQVVVNQFSQFWENSFSKAFKELTMLSQKAQAVVQLLENAPEDNIINYIGGISKGLVVGGLLSTFLGPLGLIGGAALFGGAKMKEEEEKIEKYNSLLSTKFEELEFWEKEFYNKKMLNIHKDMANMVEKFIEQLKNQIFSLVSSLDDGQKKKLNKILKQDIEIAQQEIKKPLNESGITLQDLMDFGIDLLKEENN